MKAYELDAGKDIVYAEHSTSAIGASLYQSSADPTNLASFMRNATLLMPISISVAPRRAGLHLGKIRASEDFDEPLPDDFWLGDE